MIDDPTTRSGDEATQTSRPSRGGLLRRLGLLSLVILVGLAALAYVVFWAYRYMVGILGVFAPLVAVALLALLAAILLPWLLIHFRCQLSRAIRLTAAGLRRLSLATGLPQRFASRFPRLARFLVARFAPAPATGLGLTVGLFLAGGLIWFQLELLSEVISGSSVVGTDHRVLNLVATLRTSRLDQLMYAISYLGNARTIVALGLAAVIVALLAGHRVDAILLVLATAGSALFFELIKLLVGRMRPPLEDARIVQGGFSFPSGHSTVAATFYGTVAFLLIRGLRGEPLRVLIGVFAGLIILAVGVSRVYLGVHYPSDVLAGWAAGTLWVVLLVLAEHLWRMVPQTSPPAWQRVATWIGGPVLTLAALTALVLTYSDIPPAPPSSAPALTIVAPADVPALVESSLPHYTETLFGHQQEPVSLVFVGTRSQLERAFAQAGWTEARQWTFENFAQEAGASIAGTSDASGPVTPSFLGDEPNALAFDQEVNQSIAQRHHIRLWTTSLRTMDGQDVWLATASFDRGFEIAPSSFLPTHQIDPNIDAERTYVVSALEATDLVSQTQTQTLQLVPRESGHNFAGDTFYTDGEAMVLWLANG